MKISIGILTAEKSMDRVRKIDAAMRQVCDPIYLPYTTTQHLAGLYLDNVHRFDGLLFSGSFPCEYIINYVGAIRKPYGFFDVTDRDYYKLIARIFVKYPGIDFSRVLIDQPTTHVDFEDIFDPLHMPLILSSLTREEYSSHMDSLYEIGLSFYKKLWVEKRVDLIVTRFSNLAGRLEDEKIPFEILSPSVSSMLETVQQLVGRIQSVWLENSVAASGILSVSRDLSEEESRNMERILEAFNDRNNRSLVIRRNEGAFEIALSNGVLRDITRNYAECTLTDFLNDNIDFPFCVGWGTGNDPMEAQRNAARALKEGRRGGQSLPYIVTHGNEVIGPLSSSRRIVFDDIPDERVERFGRKLKVSAVNMAKLIALTERMGRNQLSSNDLMHYLGVTQRSAGRILANLAEWGVASLVPDGGKNARGRPIKVYQVDFDKLRS